MARRFPARTMRRLVAERAERVGSHLQLRHALLLRCLQSGRGVLDLLLMRSLRQFQSGRAEPMVLEGALELMLATGIQRRRQAGSTPGCSSSWRRPAAGR